MNVDAMNMIGPACGSWGIPARGTSMRSTINPYGRVGIECVDANNCLVSRMLCSNMIGQCCLGIHVLFWWGGSITLYKAGVIDPPHDGETYPMGGRAAIPIAFAKASQMGLVGESNSFRFLP